MVLDDAGNWSLRNGSIIRRSNCQACLSLSRTMLHSLLSLISRLVHRVVSSKLLFLFSLAISSKSNQPLFLLLYLSYTLRCLRDCIATQQLNFLITTVTLVYRRFVSCAPRFSPLLFPFLIPRGLPVLSASCLSRFRRPTEIPRHSSRANEPRIGRKARHAAAISTNSTREEAGGEASTKREYEREKDRRIARRERDSSTLSREFMAKVFKQPYNPCLQWYWLRPCRRLTPPSSSFSLSCKLPLLLNRENPRKKDAYSSGPLQRDLKRDNP